MKIILQSFLALALVGTALSSQIASAQVTCSATAAVCNPLQASSVSTLLTDAVNIAIPVGAVIAVLAFIFVGFKFIAAQGKPEKIGEAWHWFMYICIGTAVLLGAKIIISLIENSLTSAGVVQQGLFGQ